MSGAERTAIESTREQLRRAPLRWLVTGCGGFIGSNLAEALLSLGQTVTGLDNFSTGHPRNIDSVREAAGGNARLFRFVEGDIRDLETCRSTCEGVDVVLHQAALGSVPRSLEDPITTNQVNVGGFLNMLVAARDAEVRRFVYAASSSTYGDDPHLPKVEERIGNPLSPYAVSKYTNELYARVFHAAYGLEVVGLRYFNVFGPRQDPEGAYAAAIPKWIGTLLSGDTCQINGDGETSRDFCYIANVVQANLLAATAAEEATGEVYNVAVGQQITLNRLYAIIRDGLSELRPELKGKEPRYADFRPGDVRHSRADLTKISTRLGYAPTHDAQDGLRASLRWYFRRHEDALPCGQP